ncbi:YSIRK-type signal peptide-containing protein, partial [Staphylococcus capitis]|uniref:YSIRK-type signal peptide-containing protein n=1 Tax=Staphylococcus capitis TaxID=29388 RepID=UPI003BFA6EAA
MNKYSIRKFTVGTASILVGATLIFGSSNDEAKAAESNSNKVDLNVENQNTTSEAPSTEEKADTTSEAPSTEEKA